MAAPCIEDGACTRFVYTSKKNLRVDVVVSSAPDNALVCTGGGLFARRYRARYVQSLDNPIRTSISGVSFGFGSIIVDLGVFADEDTGPNTDHYISDQTTLTYTNTSGVTEWAEFGVTQGTTRFHQRGGWNVTLGQEITWFGPASLGVLSGFQVPVGFNTGDSAFNPAYSQAGGVVARMGATFPPSLTRSACTIAPGETLAIRRQLYVRYDGGYGSPDNGSQKQTITCFGGGATFIHAWTRGS